MSGYENKLSEKGQLNWSGLKKVHVWSRGAGSKAQESTRSAGVLFPARILGAENAPANKINITAPQTLDSTAIDRSGPNCRLYSSRLKEHGFKVPIEIAISPS